MTPDGKAVTCLYVGPVEGHPVIDDEQLSCLASIDSYLMKMMGRYAISNIEMYANSAINVFIKDRVTTKVVVFVTIRYSDEEQAYYDHLAAEHGEA